ncbi:unnamed protein product [Prorocentrum cordatum]|uniref:Uncharacterized protein n=1 Tax=Prorocentrum cordatum TaxID=2364126 RepID=A0ABN9WP37_9DINO|nr:unnamed protein product [Polarella glacialis]
MSEENGAIRAGVLQDVQEWLSTMRERLEFFGMEVANWSNKHTKAIEDVKRLSNDSTERLHAHHVAMAERTDHVESTMTKFSEKYCRMLSDLHHQHAELSSNSESILSTMRDRLELFGTEMRHSSSSHAKAIEDVKRTSDDSAHKHHARHLAIAERLDHLENTVAEVSERHCRMLSDLQRQHAELSSGGESVPDRVTRVEQQQRDSADRFAKDRARRRPRAGGSRRGWPAGQGARGPAAGAPGSEELRQAHLEHAGHVSRAAVEERIGSVERRGSKQVDDLRGELLRHRALTEGRLEACEALLHRELSSAQDRARLIARELQRDVDTKTALVNKLTRSESSPSLSSASLRVGRGAQSSTPSLCSLAQSRWGSGALRRGEVARLPLDAESGRLNILFGPAFFKVSTDALQVRLPEGEEPADSVSLGCVRAPSAVRVLGLRVTDIEIITATINVRFSALLMDWVLRSQRRFISKRDSGPSTLEPDTVSMTYSDALLAQSSLTASFALGVDAAFLSLSQEFMYLVFTAMGGSSTVGDMLALARTFRVPMDAITRAGFRQLLFLVLLATYLVIGPFSQPERVLLHEQPRRGPPRFLALARYGGEETLFFQLLVLLCRVHSALSLGARGFLRRVSLALAAALPRPAGCGPAAAGRTTFALCPGASAKSGLREADRKVGVARRAAAVDAPPGGWPTLSVIVLSPESKAANRFAIDQLAEQETIPSSRSERFLFATPRASGTRPRRLSGPCCASSRMRPRRTYSSPASSRRAAARWWRSGATTRSRRRAG